MENAQLAIDKLITHLSKNGYKTASEYIKTAKYNMSSYIDRWGKYGLICPPALHLLLNVLLENLPED